MFEREGLGFAAVGGERETSAWVEIEMGHPKGQQQPFQRGCRDTRPVSCDESDSTPSAPRLRGVSADADAGTGDT